MAMAGHFYRFSWMLRAAYVLQLTKDRAKDQRARTKDQAAEGPEVPTTSPLAMCVRTYLCIRYTIWTRHRQCEYTHCHYLYCSSSNSGSGSGSGCSCWPFNMALLAARSRTSHALCYIMQAVRAADEVWCCDWPTQTETVQLSKSFEFQFIYIFAVWAIFCR